MSETWDDAIAALEPLHEQLQELQAQPGTQAIAEELTAHLIRVARAPAASACLSPDLARATQLVAALVVAGLWPSERLAALRCAANLCVGESYQPGWCAALTTEATSWMAFRAARRRPRVNQLPEFCEPEPEAHLLTASNEAAGIEVDYAVALPCSVDQLGQDVVEQCLEDLTLRSQHRAERAAAESIGEEERILKLGNAFCVVGQAAPQHLSDWWREQPTRDAFQAFAVAYALSVCAGAQHLDLLRACLEDLDEADLEAPRCAADALRLVPRGERKQLVEHWQRARHPVVRAAAIELGSRRIDGPPWLDAAGCGAWLTDPNPPVVLAALRGLARLSTLPEPLVPQLQQLMLGPLGAEVAIEAARCLALCGHATPYVALRQDSRALAAWGERALEVLVWFGSPEDAALLQHILKSHPQTPYTLDAVARFGIPETYSYLLHGLGQDELAEAAVEALLTLLGPLPEDVDPLLAVSWTAQLKRLKLKPGVRYRLGQAWQPRIVGQEIAPGRLSRRATATRVDELRVRLGGLSAFDPAFADELLRELSELSAGLGNISTRFNAGSYDCFTRDRARGAAA